MEKASAVETTNQPRKYGQYEQVNGGVVNDLNDKMEFLRAESVRLCSFFTSVRKENEVLWLQVMELRMNNFLEIAGETARVKFNGDHFSIVQEQEIETGGEVL